jgi:hypothetical protein
MVRYSFVGMTADSQIRLVDAHISGQLALNDAKLANPGTALSADGMTVNGGMFCRDGFRAEGEVRLRSSRINGTLAMGGAQLVNPGAYALSADGMTVDGSM